MHAELTQPSDLVVCINRRKRRIPIQDILYFQSCGRQILLHTPQETLVFYGKLNDLEPQLPEDRFLRCHQSYLVNIDCVAEIGAELLLLNGVRLPVRTRHRPALYERFYQLSVKRSQETGYRPSALTLMERKWPRN